MAARFLVLLLLPALLAGGCATILQGSRQKVRVYSEPPAAGVEVDGIQAGKTPVDVRLKRGKAHQLRVATAGYEEHVLTLDSSVGGGWVVLDLLAGGLVALTVDLVTKNWESFEHSISVSLRQSSSEIVPAAAAPDSAAQEPVAGTLRILDRELVAFPRGEGTIHAKIQIAWHTRDVQLDFGDGLHVGLEPLGPFPKDRILLHDGSKAYVLTPRGRVVSIRVATLDYEAVEIDWIDQSFTGLTAAPAVAIDEPDSTAPQSGALLLKTGEPVEFPVDGGMLLARIHHDKEVELSFGEGLYVGHEPTGPFSSNRITLKPGADAHVLTRRGRVVHIWCTGLPYGEAAIEWKRK